MWQHLKRSLKMKNFVNFDGLVKKQKITLKCALAAALAQCGISTSNA